MSDWSAFEADVRSKSRPRGPRCSVGVMLENLSEEGRRAVINILKDRGSFGTPAVVGALRDRLGGAAPSAWSISNHRRGKCACQR